MEDLVVKEAERIFGTDKGNNGKTPCSPAGYDAFIFGADFQQKQNAAEIAELVTGLKDLSYAAQTTGGTAGVDKGLLAAIADAEKLLKKYDPQ